MSPPKAPTRRDELTHKGNLRETRYGWLRLTPAYSVHLVRELLASEPCENARVLDPFCGTGTTALVCAEQGIAADTLDINPFLLWLATTKTRAYAPAAIAAFTARAAEVAEAMGRRTGDEPGWIPALFRIDRWWSPEILATLSRGMQAIRAAEPAPLGSPAAAPADRGAEPAARIASHAADLLRIAFCRTLIEQSNASFGHQSMSFKRSAPVPAAPTTQRAAHSAAASRSSASARAEASDGVVRAWQAAVRDIALGAASAIGREPRALLCDARDVRDSLALGQYDRVITSPPYPNRMSYIRELRPYMYWLGYLADGQAAGALDWRAIGGTWGAATSRVGKWTPPRERAVPFCGFAEILARIDSHSPLLARYVHKYFYDMVDHAQSMFAVVRPAGRVHYIVGNSKFYDVLLPVEQLFAALLEDAGFEDASARIIRKRTSKKELFEYVVSATKPE